ncbi:sideroflexin-4 [Mixophyes fleayi]|uniref:sideroflexin-4 n=1 Tax=Mixophyes fleayi TaxID=3061075 RepID=UPI003F4D80CD
MLLYGLHGLSAPPFTERCGRWNELLDPSRLLASEAEIKKCNACVGSLKDGERNVKEEEALKLCEASVHPDTGSILPFIFRPPALLIMGAPTVVAALFPHRTVMSAFICQVPFHMYMAGFTLANKNQSVQEEKTSLQHTLYLSASVLYLTCIGAVPMFLMKRLKISNPPMQNFFGRILPPPLFGLLGALNVLLMRYSEVENGIQVLDKEGRVVGVSHEAGKKAIRETAVSRSALVGFTVLIPSLMKRSPHMLRNPRMFNVLKQVSAVLAFGAMAPVSFSIFPQKGKIKRDNLEDDLKEKTTEPEVFYNRGV